MKKGDFNSRGFTIIEVSLVLAIAGLIFLMMFIALPALQRSQRDTRRREDMMELISQVKKYQTNNRGALPGGGNKINDGGSLVVKANSVGGDNTWAGFYNKYLGDNFIDPTGGSYELQVMNCGATGSGTDCNNSVLKSLPEASFPNNYRIIVVLQATCSSEKAVVSSNPRKLAVLYRLEGAGVYCNNS